MNKTIILFIDAFRYDDLTKKNCPFLYKLSKGGAYGRLHTLPGYHVEYSMMSGKSPKKHNVWIWYYLDKENSCFKWIRPFKKLFIKLDHTSLRNLSRNFISYTTMLFRLIQGNTRFIKVNEIPIEVLDNFNISVDKTYVDKHSLPVPTLFDILRDKKIKFAALEYPWYADNKTLQIIYDKRDVVCLDKVSTMLEYSDIVFTHIWELDSIQHKYGIKTKESLAHIKLLDNSIKELFELSQDRYGKVDIVIFSDHGMTPIDKRIHIQSLLKHYDADYFIGSTMAQVWFKDRLDKEHMRDQLTSDIKMLNCLAYNKSNINKLDIPYRRAFVGDLLIAAKPGSQFYPDFFRKDANAKAMHGYTTKNKDLDGIFIINTSNIKKRVFRDAKLVDILPTILKEVNLNG